MIDIVPLTDLLRDKILEHTQATGVLPQHHPVWRDVLNSIGEDCRTLVAVEADKPVGWLHYTVSTTPYGTVINSMPFIAYGGPATPEGDERAVRPLIQALFVQAENLGVDVLNVCSSPWISENLEKLYHEELHITHEFENFVHLQELANHPLAQLTSKRRSAFQSEINRASQAGLQVRSSLDSTQFLQWLEIYNNRYQEIDARPYPDAFHQKVFDLAVPAGAAQFWGVFDGNNLIGGNLFFMSGHYVDYFSSAFRTDYRHLYPNTFLLNEAFSSFRASGIGFFNWQSSPNRDGVFQYKARWGAREWRHYYMSVILKPNSKLLTLQRAEFQSLFPFRYVVPFSILHESSK